MENMYRFFGRAALFAVTLILAAELFFSLVLPAPQWPRGVVLETGIRRFDPNSFTSGRFAYGRLCRGGYRWTINPQGWNSVFEYLPEPLRNGKPMIAILGDSYLEGFFSNVDQHIDYYSTELYGDSVCFYTFAMSGGILSQYIALMTYEVEQYEPSGYVVFINASDVTQSFVSSGVKHPYFFQYEQDPSGEYAEVRPSAASRSQLKDILLHSAFVRYVKANDLIPIFGSGLADVNANFGAADQGGSVVVSDLKEETAFLLDKLNSFQRPVLIVADCPREWVYTGKPEEAFSDVNALMEIAEGYPNITVIELAEFYVDAYREDHRRFGLDDNPHWGGYSNRRIAEFLHGRIDYMLNTTGTEADD